MNKLGKIEDTLQLKFMYQCRLYQSRGGQSMEFMLQLVEQDQIHFVLLVLLYVIACINYYVNLANLK